MKLQLLAAVTLLLFALGTMTRGQTNGGASPIWTTPVGVHDYSDAPSIDALIFLNPAGATFEFEGANLYTTLDTLSFTNQGIINVDPGFDFATCPAGSVGQVTMADSWVNEASSANGVINCTSGFFASTVTSIAGAYYLFGALTGGSECLVSASNILNSGTINMDASSLMKFDGYNVDLSRGTLAMAGANSTNLLYFSGGFLFESGFGQGWLDGYWGVGSADPKFPNTGQASLLYGCEVEDNESDVYQITLRNEESAYDDMFLEHPAIYIQDSGIVGSNRWVQAVFLQNTNQAFANSVYFPGAETGFGPAFEILVQWQWLATNLLTRTVSTNFILISDDFGEVTNIGLNIDGFINGQSLFPETTYIPENYSILEGVSAAEFGGGTPAAPTTVVPGQLGCNLGPYTNQYAAYEAYFTPGTALPTDTAGGNVTNLPGRIEINARNVLSLTNTSITALNYLLLNATNHFAGAPRAQISSPNNDFLLRTTNGVLSFTNLVLPFINVPSGPVELWSARYTNVVNGITNSYHVLFVNSEITPVTTPLVQTLNLTVTNIGAASNQLYISDIVNVTSNLLITCPAVTLTTNGPDALNPFGELNLLNPNTLWPSSFPQLQYLTNWGQISNGNSIYFNGAISLSPYSLTSTNLPYQAFVNHGSILGLGTVISSLYFENEGLISASLGSIVIQDAFNSVVNNGVFYAPGGDVTIDSASLLVSNQAIISGGALTLSNTYYLDDGSYATASAFNVTNKNSWSVENGIDLPVLPTYSSLLATTITNTSLNQAPVYNTWAGNDLGPVPAGFAANAAVGHLILDGQNLESLFVFAPPGSGPNALYVDLLDLRNFATNADAQGNTINIQIMPGMKIYFGRALMNGVEASVHLSGRAGTGPFASASDSGTFQWVTNYFCGFFSSTNLFYSSVGSSNLVNAGLYFYCQNAPQDVASSDCESGLPTLLPNSCPATPPEYISATPPGAASISVSSEADEYTAPATIELFANVVTNGHSIQKVLIYNGSQYGASLLASNPPAPYSCVWSNVGAGSYTPTAVLVYDQGSVVVATPFNVVVNPGSNNATEFGGLQVVLAPAGAISAGAQWQLDGGGWQTSGAILTNCVVGDHTVSFRPVGGWTAPTNVPVLIGNNQTTRITGAYTYLDQGAVQVALMPVGAIVSGAAWQIDGGPWLASGVTATGVSSGAHGIAFKPIGGWLTPASQTLKVLEGETFVTNAVYTGLSYAFSTIAGNPGHAGYADSTNSRALFDNPSGIAWANGVFIADTGNSVIRQLEPDLNTWVSATIAGSAGTPGDADGTNEQARFDYPTGVASSGAGIIVADQVNSTIRLLTLSSNDAVITSLTTTIAGVAGMNGSTDGTNGVSRFYYPAGVAADPSGNMYVADQLNSVIRKIAPLGSNSWMVTTVAGTAGVTGSDDGTNGSARFYWPGAVTVDEDSTIYVADTFNDTIRRIIAIGTNYVVTTICGDAGLNGAVDGTNNDSLFDGPNGIAVDAAGNLYVADSYSSLIRKITPTGTNWVVNTIGGSAYNPGSQDGTNAVARFDSPFGICLDTNGVLYVADTSNQTIRRGVPVSPAPPSFTLSATTPIAGLPALSWTALPGLSYQVQYKTNLLQTTWLNWGTPVLATNSVMTFMDTMTSGSQRFYRVVLMVP